MSSIPIFQLDDFSLKAKIDFITLKSPHILKTATDPEAHAEVNRSFDGMIKEGDDWFTIHDPSRADLQYLLDYYPEIEIQTLEVAVDLYLKDGSNDIAKLQAAHKYLTINLFPQRHSRMKGSGRRKYYLDGAIKFDSLKTKSGSKTIYWKNSQEYEQVRLYIKTYDNEHPIERHSTRLEATLFRGGCQKASVSHICLLPTFVKHMRRYLSPFFHVAAGIKLKIKRSRTGNPLKKSKAIHEVEKERLLVERSYKRFGASWAAWHGYNVISDKAASKMIGNALKTLREHLLGLKLPDKSAELATDQLAELAMYQALTKLSFP